MRTNLNPFLQISNNNVRENSYPYLEDINNYNQLNYNNNLLNCNNNQINYINNNKNQINYINNNNTPNQINYDNKNNSQYNYNNSFFPMINQNWICSFCNNYNVCSKNIYYLFSPLI